MQRFLGILALLAPLLATAQSLPERHVLFEGDVVHEIWLNFQQPDWYEQLVANFSENEDDVPYIEASFQWNEFAFDKVGVRIKGNSTARVASMKKPFRIKFNEYTKGQKIDGVGAINLNNVNGDASMVREKMYFELARQTGIKAPRMNWAALYVNGQYWGLYLMGEIINDDFLKNHFVKAERDGWLYKANIGSTFEDWGTDKDRYKQVWEKKSFEDEDDWSDLMNLATVLNQTPAEELEAKIGEVLDVDSFWTALALDNITVNLDSYVVMTQNFYIYRRPTDNKFEWLVWDPSLAFGSFPGGFSAAQMQTLPLEYTGSMGGGGRPGSAAALRPLAQKLWAVPSIKARYREIYQRLALEVFHTDNILARMSYMQSVVRPWVEGATYKLTTLAQFDAALTTGTVAAGPGVPGGGMGGGPAVKPLIEGRKAFVMRELGLAQ